MKQELVLFRKLMQKSRSACIFENGIICIRYKAKSKISSVITVKSIFIIESICDDKIRKPGTHKTPTNDRRFERLKTKATKYKRYSHRQMYARKHKIRAQKITHRQVKRQKQSKRDGQRRRKKKKKPFKIKIL